MTAKLVAKAFWKEEVNQELSDLRVDEKWSFVPNADSCLSGTYDDAMEYANKHRSQNIYSHDCSELCKKKGNVYMFEFSFVFQSKICCILPDKLSITPDNC